MGQDASTNRQGGNETASAKDKKFVHLPNTCSWWKDFKSFLIRLQAKEISSIEDYIVAFKENDPFKEAKELITLKVMSWSRDHGSLLSGRFIMFALAGWRYRIESWSR